MPRYLPVLALALACGGACVAGPRGRATLDTPCYGAWFALNGNGEMTGTAWLEESGQLEGPVMLTNTHSVGVVRDAVIAWRVRGGGTGMICHEFKCGIGTASRRLTQSGQGYMVGVLVQANYGVRDTLRIAGVPVGREIREDRIYSETDPQPGDIGSIVIVVATDAPLLPHQLQRLAKRAGLGLARMGSFAATVEATEEAIVNAMVAARDMQGNAGHHATALPHERLVELLRRYGRSAPRH